MERHQSPLNEEVKNIHILKKRKSMNKIIAEENGKSEMKAENELGLK